MQHVFYIQNPNYKKKAKLKENLMLSTWNKGIYAKNYNFIQNKRGPLLEKDIQKIYKKTTNINRNFCGGMFDLTIPNIAGPYQYLITPEMFCILTGAIASDGYISKYGAIQINQTIRQNSNYKLTLHLIRTLAPIISYVELCATKPIAIDINTYLLKNQTKKPFLLNINKINNELNKIVYEINKLKTKKIKIIKRQNVNTTNKIKSSFYIRIITYSLFKDWHAAWYKKEKNSTKFIKQWPTNIMEIYRNPITLATQIMMDGSRRTFLRTLKTGVQVAKVSNTSINLGSLDPEIFKKILNNNFYLFGYYRKEGNKNNYIFTIQSDIAFKGRGGHNQALFYELVSPFIIPEMERKLYNIKNLNRKLTIKPYTQEQLESLPTTKIYNTPCSFQYQDYSNIFFDYKKFLVYDGAHREELPNGDLYMSIEQQHYFIKYFSIVYCCNSFIKQQVKDVLA
jgi:hypothetical protein